MALASSGALTMCVSGAAWCVTVDRIVWEGKMRTQNYVRLMSAPRISSPASSQVKFEIFIFILSNTSCSISFRCDYNLNIIIISLILHLAKSSLGCQKTIQPEKSLYYIGNDAMTSKVITFH